MLFVVLSDLFDETVERGFWEERVESSLKEVDITKGVI